MQHCQTVSNIACRPLLFQLPDLLLTFLHFLAAFSSGLALLNLVPCYLLDGHHIARAAVDLLLAHSASEVGRVNIFYVALKYFCGHSKYFRSPGRMW